MERSKQPRRAGHTRVSSKGQITIPAATRTETGLRPGDELRVEADGEGRIVLTRVESLGERRRKAIRETAGSLTGVWEPGDLDRLRDERR